MWNDRYSQPWIALAFDPATAMMAGSMAIGAVGTGITAMGTLSGGNAAASAARLQGQMQKQEADYEAAQLETNAVQEVASAQRQALDKRLQTKLTLSTLAARAGASGVDASTGSPLHAAGEIAQRGEYQALMDMFQGQNAATGLRNKAAGIRQSGKFAEIGAELSADAAQRQAKYSALGTLASGASSLLKTGAAFGYPTSAGKPGVSLPG